MAQFPKSFVLNKSLIPVPALSPAGRSLKPLLMDLQIYVTRTEKFITHPRDIFKKEVIPHTTPKESNEWLAGPNMRYWPQQLNFAVWCATTACGISFEDHLLGGKKIPPQIVSFCRFHVYYTIRRILKEMGAALPDSTVFSAMNNPYSHEKYNALCREFKVTPRADFRFKEGPNKGLGYTWTTGSGDRNMVYNGRDFFLTDKDKYYKSGLHKIRRQDQQRARIYLMKNTDAAGQYNRFVAAAGKGLTMSGLARLSESVCAYVYCILGSQARIRSSIVGDSGGASLAQKQFLELLEDMINDEDSYPIYKRYQDTITETKVKLDMAISPNIFLLPSKMVIETGPAVVGYNNELQYATEYMKFGYNDDINTERLESAVAAEMEGPPDKVARVAATEPTVTEPTVTEPIIPVVAEPDPIHEHTKTGLIAAAAGTISILIYTFR